VTDQLLKELEENRLEKRELESSREDTTDAAEKIKLDISEPEPGLWGENIKWGLQAGFKPRYDPPRYGSIHYWLAYGREILHEARLRKAFLCEIRCAIIALERHSRRSQDSVHNTAALRIWEELTERGAGYTRKPTTK